MPEPRLYVLRWLGHTIAGLNRLNPAIRGVSIVGMFFFVIMVVLTFSDVLLRYLFNRPIDGTVEITELMMVIVVFCGVGYAQVTRSHVTMDILVGKLDPKSLHLLRGITNLLSILLFVIVSWRNLLHAFTTPELTLVFNFPIKPFAALAGLGGILILIPLLSEFLSDMRNAIQGEGSIWIWMFAVPLMIFLAAFAAVIYQPLELSLPVLGILGICIMLLFFSTGMPIAFVLFAVGLFVLSYIRGPGAGLEMIGKSWYKTVASYPWSPLMFFLLMGYICFHSKLGEDIFLAANRWLGHFRGGLAMAAVAACAGFGAVVGDTLSGSIAMSAIGLPEMRRYRYDDALAIGTLTCAGTLGTLIPPSIGFILYGVLAEQSIGELFISGIVPGLICSVCFIGIIWVRTRLNPGLAPAAPKAELREKVASLKNGGPIAALFSLVIVGIYLGIFTATEGGGIGAFGAFVMALIMGRLNWKRFTDALADAARFTAMCFTLLGGACLFGYMIAMSTLPYGMSDFIGSLRWPPMAILLAMLLVLFLLGCFIPSIPMLLICVPIFLPIAKSFGWDLIWFGVLMVLMFNIAAITPPFGINLFVMSGVTKTNMGVVFRGALPFVLGLVACTLLVLVFPSLALWLPYLLK